MKSEPFKRILVATDFSTGGDEAFARALSLAGAMSATVNLIHVLDPALLTGPVSLGAMPLIDYDAFSEEIDRALTLRAAQARDAGVVCQTDSLDGYPSGEIVRHARQTAADLIVVGTHGRTGIAHALLGSVAERVVQRSPCPVLVIPQVQSGN